MKLIFEVIICILPIFLALRLIFGLGSTIEFQIYENNDTSDDKLYYFSFSERQSASFFQFQHRPSL